MKGDTSPHRFAEKRLNQRCAPLRMTTNIEHRVQALQGYPLTDDITNDHKQYRLWFLANFGESIADNTFSEHKECQNHIDRIAQLQGASYGSALFHIKDDYISFLHERAERLGEIVQDTLTQQFISYSTASHSYLEKLTEAVDDHLGTSPDHITSDNIESMRNIHLNLQRAYELIENYGYKLEGTERKDN